MTGWQGRSVRSSGATRLLLTTGGVLLALTLSASAQEATSAAAHEQGAAAAALATGTEKAARLAQEAGQKIVDAIRAHRRAVWLTKTAHALRQRDDEDYTAAARGAELARSDWDAKNRAAKAAVNEATEALDAVPLRAAGLKEADAAGTKDVIRASNKVVQAATAIKDAAKVVKDDVRELDTARLQVELSRSKVTDTQVARLEESVAKKKAALTDSVERLAAAGAQLGTATDELRQVSVQTEKAEQGSASGFGGFGFGVGVNFSFDVGGRDRVDSASVDSNGIVRVSKDNSNTVGVMLEGHYFIVNDSQTRFPWCRSRACAAVGPDGSKCMLCNYGLAPAHVGWGPFVGLRPGGSDFIDAVSVGLMVGLRSDALFKGDSFNLGVGYVVDPNTKVLADGFNENQPPPNGETQVRFRETTQNGVQFSLTYGF